MAAEDNYKKLRTELDDKLKADSRLKAIAAKISAGTADFKDTSEYTQIVARYMGEVISSNIGSITNPLGKEMVCKALLRDEYESINGVLGEVQTSIDDKLGIHIKPVKPAYPTERVDKAAHSLEDPTVPESTIKRRARSTSENITNSFHDDYIKENAKFRSKAGLKCYITRETDGKCCPWCSGIAGRYEYGTEPHDIYRRHDNCGCTVTYENGRQRQDVWSKRTWEAPEPNAGAEKPKVFSREQAERLNAEQVEKVRKFEPEINTVEAPALISTDYEKITQWEVDNYKNKTESGLLIMPDGTEKAFGGIDHHVTGDKKDIKLMKGAVFTHNHPTDNTFSQNDIVTGLVQGNLKEMRAVTSTGDIHILVNNGASDSDRRKFSAAYSQRRMKAANVADKKLRRGESIDKDSYIKESLEKFMAEHAGEYNLSYSKGNVEEFYIDKSSKSGILKVEPDEYVPCLRDNKTGELVNTEVRQITDYSELSECNERNGWDFPWSTPPSDTEVFSLHVEKSDDIEGLIALRKEQQNNAVYMYWGNAAPHNQVTESNPEKKYNGVGGHLFAIAIRESIDSGFGGYVYADAANKELFDMFINNFKAIPLSTRDRPYRFTFSREGLLDILNTYNYDWR